MVILGRHVPGFRIPITLVAGTLRMRFPVFAASVAISTSLWVAAWFAIEARFGRASGRFLAAHRWTYFIVAGVVLLAIVTVVVREVRGQARSRRRRG
ncbi:MAG: hypothetical protein J2O48_11310 [Solirubrobacterales bacterium]|nr:hypothetical protein [Solirubrobacterales bacterium]